HVRLRWAERAVRLWDRRLFLVVRVGQQRIRAVARLDPGDARRHQLDPARKTRNSLRSIGHELSGCRGIDVRDCRAICRALGLAWRVLATSRPVLAFGAAYAVVIASGAPSCKRTHRRVT